MNFLNEVAMDYPHAISFAPGRPPEDLFKVKEHLEAIHGFVADLSRRTGLQMEQAWQQLGQYHRTNGIINELIAAHLAQDEGIRVSSDAIMVTVGAQEAMAVILAGLFEPAQDILLSSDPTYIGITGLARIFGIRVVAVPAGDDGIEPRKVEEAIARASALGRVRALYDIPDFNNPLGTMLPLERRKELIEVCRLNDVLLIEDNPYGLFVYEGERLPSLKSLDSQGTVLYIGSFSKTLFPGLRLGYLVADQATAPQGPLLARELSKAKSLITVNTSPIMQAVVGGVLLASQGTIAPAAQAKIERLHRNRDVMVNRLARNFCGFEGTIHWNRPRGGFFLTLTLPFGFGREELKICAEDYGVVVCPMCLFALGPGREHQIRLSFSYVTEDEIHTGLDRLTRFVRKHLA